MVKLKDVTMCRLTAMQIESGKNLPPRLQEIGKQIEVKLAKADMYQGKAIDMFDLIGRLLDEAKEFCDGGGFDAFKRTCCPSLGKSRAYEMLAIASGKKALEDVRAETLCARGKAPGKQNRGVPFRYSNGKVGAGGRGHSCRTRAGRRSRHRAGPKADGGGAQACGDATG